MVIPRTYGRMGNFLFQAACAMGYAWRHGLEFTLPNTTNDGKHNPIYLQHLVRSHYDPQLPKIRVVEKGHPYQFLPFEESWRGMNIELDGYWQSEQYFKEFRPRILETMCFEWERKPGTVSVHVRRGDYLRLAHKHPPVTKEWLDNVMRQFPGYRFHFFSDDRAWCVEHYGKRKDCVILASGSEVSDLEGLSCCEHNICSPSTFAWWGAWLNRNEFKRVIIPSWWFTPGWDGIDTKDIVPLEWERMG